MSGYWPWWAGAVALALVTINYTLTTDRSLGVSAAWDRVLHWRRERTAETLDAGVDERVLAQALAAGARELDGPAGPGPAIGPPAAPAGPAPAGSGPDGPAASPRRPVPLAAQAALLVSVTVGGAVAAAVSGRLELRLDMGEAFGRLVTADPLLMVGVLFVGGVLVGFGTRLAGGCSSGHGLSGCGRLQPVSILATAVFFGTAVAVSFLLGAVG